MNRSAYTEETTLPLSHAARVAVLEKGMHISLDAALHMALLEKELPGISPMRLRAIASEEQRAQASAEMNALRASMHDLFMAANEIYNIHRRVAMSSEIRIALQDLRNFSLSTQQAWSALSKATNLIESCPVPLNDKVLDAIHDAKMLLAAYRRQQPMHS